MLVYDPLDKTVRAWFHAEIEGPCFVATITSLETGESNRAALLDCAYTLYRYLLYAKGVEIKHIQMMCPPSVSGKSHWVLEDLVSVTIVEGLESPDSAVMYRTSESMYKIGELDLRKKKRSRIIYSTQHLQDHDSKPNPQRLASGLLQLYGPMQ
jgi:hypothetical protein